jgi:glyoxylase-like metal-dependent hydrolase (beta-lactamase superfamily II)
MRLCMPRNGLPCEGSTSVFATANRLGIAGESWEVVTGFGHSPEHCALFCAASRVLISGDMVLPRISTNVSVFENEPEGNPLALYLESLGRYEPMPVGIAAEWKALHKSAFSLLYPLKAVAIVRGDTA